MHFAFITYHELPNLNRSDRLAADTLEKRGHTVDAMLWDAPEVDWAAYHALVIRSPWDYHKRLPEFLRWLDHLEQVGARVLNPIPLLRWNLHKTYLRDLEARGVPIVPTVWIERDQPIPVTPVLEANGWAEVVSKPTIGATAYRTERFKTSTFQSIQDHVESLAAESGVMLQPFLHEITSAGEWSFIFLNGVFSHAILKRAQSGDFRVQDEYGGTIELMQPPADLLAQAQHVIAKLDQPALYARVDGVVVEGRLLLMELEMVEPELYFAYDPPSAERFADALLRLIDPSI